MARPSSFPVSAPPVAPPRQSSMRIWLRAWGAFALFGALAHSFWFNLLGPIGAVALLLTTTLVTCITWVRLSRTGRGPGFPARRLPWLTLGYVGLAGLSVVWSIWPAATATTWVLLTVMTVHGVFLAAVLTWTEIVRALEVASRWVIGLSVVMEIWIGWRQQPLGPNFLPRPEDADAHWFWVRGHLFEDLFVGERIQGAVGNANLLAYVAAVALVVFIAQFVRRPGDRVPQGAWIVVTAYLFLRAGSVAALAAVFAAGIVLVGAMLIRRIRDMRRRLSIYGLYVAALAAFALAMALFWRQILDVLGRDETLTGRDQIWDAVIHRAQRSPIFGSGFSSPWVPWDPQFDGWILDHGMTIFHAHNVWVDVYLQLGYVGIVLLAFVYIALMWRSWFFAVDRPRWDLDADRPYHAFSLVPLSLTVIILVQGYAESNPLTNWGWLFIVMFAFKLKISPILGYGPYERADQLPGSEPQSTRGSSR